jgi:hypothetical protein
MLKFFIYNSILPIISKHLLKMTKTYKINSTKKQIVSVSVISDDYEDFKSLMPWIDWEGAWAKCIP